MHTLISVKPSFVNKRGIKKPNSYFSKEMHNINNAVGKIIILTLVQVMAVIAHPCPNFNGG